MYQNLPAIIRFFEGPNGPVAGCGNGIWVFLWCTSLRSWCNECSKTWSWSLFDGAGFCCFFSLVVEWQSPMMSWMPGRTVAMIWFPTTMWGMGAWSWTASFANWLNSSLQNSTFWAASSFCCQCMSIFVAGGPDPSRFMLALHKSSWSAKSLDIITKNCSIW